MNRNNDTREMTADLAALISTSGRIFTLIRARTWDAGHDPHKAVSAVQDIRAWSDAAHNLSSFGEGVRRAESGLETDQDRFGGDGHFLARVLEREASRSEAAHPLVGQALREAAALVSRVTDRLAAEEEGPQP